MKKTILIFCSILFVLIITFILNFSFFNIKISIKSNNTLPIEINNNIAIPIELNLLKIKEIKDFYIYSKFETCNIYIKTTFLSKKTALNKIKTQLKNSIHQTKDDLIITIDDDYQRIYDYFLIFDDKDLIYLNNKFEMVKKDILSNKISQKLIELNDIYQVTYLNYNYQSLLKFDLDLSDIKKIINQNNIFKNTKNSSYLIDTSSTINNLEDIKNINIFYKNNDFLTKLSNVFKIEHYVNQNPNYLISYNGKNSIILGISTKNIFTKRKLKKYKNCQLVSTKNLKKISIFVENNEINFDKVNEINRLLNIKDVIFLVGIDCPKINHSTDFFEIDKNKITILSKPKDYFKIKNVLKENNYDLIKNDFETIKNKNLKFLQEKLDELDFDYINLSTYKTNQIEYVFDNYSLNSNYFKKEDIINSIISNTLGLNVGYYFYNDLKIPIMVKNIDNINQIYCYSKKFKTLIDVESIASKNIKSDYYSILRNKGKYVVKAYYK